jgi:hypothetical protein
MLKLILVIMFALAISFACGYSGRDWMSRRWRKEVRKKFYEKYRPDELPPKAEAVTGASRRELTIQELNERVRGGANLRATLNLIDGARHGVFRTPHRIAVKSSLFSVELNVTSVPEMIPDSRLSSTGLAPDGKALRQSFDAFQDRKAAHILSAFASASTLVLAHLDCDEKSNEIPAVQALLRQLGLEEALLTVDAMHCQKNI